ncbi:DUF3611 family protein [Lyngbya sp. PCC 8106]|uniref:DUF3611 family protein n=1 Tax=Lyngbya sp. (strain PCC 8106) TaxID=313612 RepID=UPI0000EACE2E|nr:DUF3611 family protein [Lyngbya sp. PCC 8106]EAW34771.1 hypothetical protein L8106_26152 [Lyngbya sp. PCC 8106]
MNSSSVSPNLKKKALNLRLTGWSCFWLQIVGVLVSGISLLFVVTGRQISAQTNPAMGWGILFAISGIIAAVVSIILAFWYTRVGQRLRKADSTQPPPKSDLTRLLQLGLIIGLGGMFVTLIGSGLTAAVLVAKTISQPPGTTLTDASEAVRALDVLIMVANLNGVAAHFIGTVTSIWLKYQV